MSTEIVIATSSYDIAQVVLLFTPLLFLLVCIIMTVAHLRKRGKTWKDFGFYGAYTLMFTVAIDAAWWIIGSSNEWFVVLCKMGADCPTQWEIFLFDAMITTPFLFLIAFQVVLGIVLLRLKLDDKK